VETAYVVTETTVVSTSVARTVTSTTTIYSSSLTGSPSSGDATSTVYSLSTVMVSPSPVSSDNPIGEDYSCPAHDNTTQVIVVNSEIFSYHILCNSSFAENTAFSTTVASSRGNCMSLCSYMDSQANGPVCKGFSFDGAYCSLYTEAFSTDLISGSWVDSAILEAVQAPLNTTFSNRTVEDAEISSIASSITTGKAMVTPPPQSNANSTATTSCFTSFSTDSSNGEVFWTSSCTWSAWWASYTVMATTVYSSELVLVARGSGANGAGAAGGAAVTTDASGSAGAVNTSPIATSTAISGLMTGGSGTGGAAGPWETTLTTIIQGTTYTTTIIFAESGSGSGSNATGGVNGVSSTGTALSRTAAGGTENGGVGSPLVSTVTTVVGQSTSTYVTTFATSGSGSGGTGIGGHISPTIGAWNFSTTFYMSGGSAVEMSNSVANSGQTSSGTSSGGVLPISSNLSVTISNASTFRSAQTSGTSGIASGGNATGGVVTLSTGTNEMTTTLLISTAVTSSVTGASNGEDHGVSASGGVISPSPSTPFSATTETGDRSGQASPPGTSPSGTAPTTTVHSIPGWNYTAPLSVGTAHNSNTTSSAETTPGVPSSGFPVLTSNGQQSPVGNSSSFPTLGPNSTWLGETHLPQSSTTSAPGYGFQPPSNYTLAPETTTSPSSVVGTSGFSVPISNMSWSASTTEGPRSGHQSSPGSSLNTTWLGETYPAPTTIASSIPIPIFSVNSSGSLCATITRETVTQTIYTSGTPGCVCASTPYAGFPWGGYGPFFGGGASSSLQTASTPTSSVPSSTTTLSLDQVRRPNMTATPDQVTWACNNNGNQIFNGGFEITDDNSEPLGWGFETSTTDLLPPTFNSAVDSSQLTIGGSREGSVITYDMSSMGNVLQPLTLCPNSTYTFAAYTKVARILAECTATFIINDEVIGIVSPGVEWGSGISSLKDFTAGVPEADLQISVQCIGSGDAMGRRVLDLDEVSLTITTSS
jgi:hypothetical protein